jgi:HSP20 family protein
MSVTKKAPRPPLSALSLLQREVNQLFERLSGFERTERPLPGEWSPSVDVYESRGRLVVVAEVPGLTPESLRLVCRERELVISGERRERRPAAGIAAFLCMERPHGRFVRTIRLDVAVDLKQAEAHLAGGVLTVTLPRLKDRRGRETTIPIEWEQEP